MQTPQALLPGRRYREHKHSLHRPRVPLPGDRVHWDYSLRLDPEEVWAV